MIAAEHGKLMHWKESLKVEQDQLLLVQKEIADLEKEKFEEEEKLHQSYQKATRSLEANQEKAHLKGVVDNMLNNVVAGETSLVSVVKTLAEYLGKLIS